MALLERGRHLAGRHPRCPTRRQEANEGEPGLLMSQDGKTGRSVLRFQLWNSRNQRQSRDKACEHQIIGRKLLWRPVARGAVGYSWHRLGIRWKLQRCPIFCARGSDAHCRFDLKG